MIARPASMATFILVPGAWLGGWCWKDVANRLEAQGHRVLAPTLSGIADRAHLLTRETSLQTHVADVVDLLDRSDQHRVMLVGHSYGGTVITAAAEHSPARISCLIYLDASVPQHGQSNNDVLGPEWAAELRAQARIKGDGWRVPPPSVAGWDLPEATRLRIAPLLTPHPLRSFEEPVWLRSMAAAMLPRAFLRSSPQSALYGELMARARHAGWRCVDIEGGHYAMLSQPQGLAAALHGLAGSGP